MAFAEKYQGTFENLPDGTTITVHLEKDGYGGGSSSIDLGGPLPVVRSDGLQSSKLFGVMRAGLLHIKLTPPGVGVINDIYSDNAEWRVIVKIDGSEDVRGLIIRDGREKSLDDYGGEYSLTAMCGLGKLKTFNLFDELVPDGLFGPTSQKTIAGWIIWALDKIGHALPIYTYSNYYAQGMSGSDDPFAQEHVRSFAYISEGRTDMTVYEFLQDITKGFYVHQREGAWHVYSRRGFQGSSITRYQYASGGTGAAGTGISGSYNTQVTASTPQSDRLSGGRMPALSNARSASIKYDHGAPTELFANSDFRIPGGTVLSFDYSLAKYWTLSGAARTLHGLVQTPDGRQAQRTTLEMETLETTTAFPEVAIKVGDSATSDVVDIESTGVDAIQIAPRVYVELSEDGAADSSIPFSFDLYFIIKHVSGGTTYYLKRDKNTGAVSWETNESFVVVTVPGNEDFEIQIKTPALIGDGTLQAILYGSIDSSDVGYSGGAKPSTKTYWQHIRALPVLSDSDGATQSSTTYKATVSGGSEGIDRKPLPTSIGTGPSSRHHGAILDVSGGLINDYGVGPQTGAPSGKTRAELIAKDMLAMTWLSLDEMRATYSNSVKPNPIKAVVESAAAYLPVFCEYDYKTGKTSVVAPKVLISDFTAEFDAVADDTVANMTGRSGAGQAIMIDRFKDFLRNFSEWNALTQTTSNLTGVITAIPVESIPAAQAVLGKDKWISIAGLNGGVFEFQLSATPSAPITSIPVVYQDIGSVIIPSGSGVYPGTGDLVSVQTQTRNALFQAIQSGNFSTLTGDVDGAAIINLPVSATPFDIEDNWVVEVGPSSDPDYYGEVFEATIDGAQTAPDTALDCDATEIHALTGDPVRLKQISLVTSITQNASEIVLRAKRDELIDDINTVVQTSITIDPDKISVDGTTVFSSGYDPSEKSRTWVQTTAPLSGMVSGDHWIDSDDGNRPYSYSGAAWVEDLTIIDGGSITTGQIQSNNWALGYGSEFDLTNGRLRLGGSSAPFFDADAAAGTLSLSGSITITAGSGISNLSDAGALVVANNLDEVPDGTTYERILATDISAGHIVLSQTLGDIDDIGDGTVYKRTTANEKTGAGRGYSGLDSSNRLITSVLPAVPIGTPGGSGLYLGSDKMGYYSGAAWTTYMDVSGNFYLGGTGGNLTWAAGTSTLTISGSITITGGSGIANLSDAGALATLNLVDTAQIQNGAIEQAQLGTDSVTEIKIMANAVTETKITSNSISSAKIKANAVTADKISVTDLSAINADMGSLTSGSIVIGSTNIIWLNDSADGALNIGGSVKGSAPFSVTSTGALTATNATLTGSLSAASGDVTIDTNGITLASGTGSPNIIEWKTGAQRDFIIQAGNSTVSLVVTGSPAKSLSLISGSWVALTAATNASVNFNTSGTGIVNVNSVQIFDVGMQFSDLTENTISASPASGEMLEWDSLQGWRNRSVSQLGLVEYKSLDGIAVTPDTRIRMTVNGADYYFAAEAV